MTALITGASSGMGADFARQLAKKGYDLILVARREDRLRSLADEITARTGAKVTVYPIDLRTRENCLELFDKTSDADVDILINNAGFGLLGRFEENDLDRELDMINLNIKAAHILMKMFLCKFYQRGSGKILNVASVGGFMPGPLLATYYATKAYLVSLTAAVREEVRRDGMKDIYVGCFCPGPVNTEFSSVANVSFALKGKQSRVVVRYALIKMLKRRRGIIIPGLGVKLAALAAKLSPVGLCARITYLVQKKKTEKS